MRRPYNWTDEQVEKLKEFYPNNYNVDVADAIGVSPGLVSIKAKKLGLQKAPGFNPYGHYGRYVKKGNHFNTHIDEN